MRHALDRMKAIITVALAIALVLGPCISLTGFQGPSAAHAHAGEMKASPGAHEHMNHGASRDSTQAPVHHGQPLSCEELCEGWAIAKSKRDKAEGISLRPEPASSVAIAGPLLPGEAGPWLREPPPPRVSLHDPRQRESHLLTRRLRL